MPQKQNKTKKNKYKSTEWRNVSSLIAWRQTLMKLLRWPSLRMLETPCCLATFWRISRRLSLGSKTRRNQNHCYLGQCYTSGNHDVGADTLAEEKQKCSTESGLAFAERGTCFKYKQLFPSSESDKHGDWRRQERRLSPLTRFPRAHSLNSGMITTWETLCI